MNNTIIIISVYLFKKRLGFCFIKNNIYYIYINHVFIFVYLKKKEEAIWNISKCDMNAALIVNVKTEVFNE